MHTGFWRNRTFGQKILLNVFLISSVALLISGTAMVGYEASSARKDFTRETTVIADIISQTCASAITFQDAEFATRILVGLEAEDSIINACIYNTNNDMIASYRKFDPQFTFPLPDQLQDFEFPSGTFGLTRPVVFGEEKVGTIFIQAQLSKLAEKIRIYILIMTATFLLALLLSLVLATRIMKAITQPVMELQNTASQISRQHNYNARAKQFSNDELGQLTSDFNNMLDQIQKKDSALRQSEARFTDLLGRIDEVIFRISMPDRTFEYCSPAALNMFGYSSQQLLDDPQLFRSMIHPESLVHIDAAYALAAAGELAPEFEFRILDRNENEKWLVQTNSPVFDENGNLVAIEGCCFNISDRKIAEKERAHFKAELAQTHRLEALGTLAGGIAHDFNNMLAAIMGYAGLVKEELPEDHSAYELVEPILTASERAKALVRQILIFSRQDQPEQKVISLADIISEALILLRASLPSSITIRATLPDDLPPVMADPIQIHQVIMNLCTNSFHAMREGGGLLSLDLALKTLAGTPKRTVGNSLELSISDTGEGISSQVQDRMFDPFFTTKKKGEGTGMGLAVVYGIVHEHGGSITVKSTLGEGAIFRIQIPCVQETIQMKEIESIEIANDTGQILFVDDEELLVNMGCRMLEKIGYEVDGFENPWTALATFSKNPERYDLVITDYTMPNISGVDLAKKIHGQRNDLPIIILTGHQELLLPQDAAKYGVVRIATKPISFKSLNSLVKRVLDEVRQNK